MGAGHCDYYAERPIKTVSVEQNNAKTEKTKSKKLPDLSVQFAEQLYPAGTLVKHKKRGFGVIKGLETRSDGVREVKRIIVEFDDGSEIKFGLEMVLNSELLQII